MSAVHAGDRVGAYEIRELLGQGGMGAVYLAHDPRLGRELALKLLAKRADEDESAVDRFVREARAASALNHPNVVTIYEIGEDASGRYIAMEYISGITLRRLIDRGPDEEQLSRVGAQIACALAVAHEAGIVHRDIKPENIMVRADGLVKVLDFGIARLVASTDGTAREVVPTQIGRAVGTLRYMSPEQACAEPVTTASDVFSLGIILHELATGQHPFAMRDMPTSDVAVVSRILTATASPASALNPTMPTELDVLLLRMLEKDARRRPAAREVESVLTELSVTTRSGLVVTSEPTRARHAVGRKRESEVLREALADADAGRGNIVSVSGEPGMGKTTLVEEFLSDVATSARQQRVAHGRCSERLAGTEAYLPLLEALDSLTRGTAAAAAVALMKRLAPTWFLQIAPVTDGDSSEARALVSIQASSQERMKRELTTFLTELSAATPVVLFLDDLHWADVSTVDVLAYLGARLGGMRLLVLVTVRPAELLLSKHPFALLKLDLQARGICREIALEFLSANDVEDYLAVQFPDHEFPSDFAALVHTKTEGSPLFMADVLQYLRTRGVVAMTNGRWRLAKSLSAIEHDLPESIRGMIQRKIEQLTEEDRKLLVAASVQGYEFDSAVVADLTNIDAADLEERLERLEHVYGFVRRSYEQNLPDGTLSVRYRFVHVLYQNALYASLTPSRRIATAGRAAQSLTQHYGERTGDIAADLALLYESARDTRRAVEQLTIAAENAARVFANQEALALAQRGLASVAQLADSSERAEREMLLWTLFVNAHGAIHGIANAEVGQAAARAYELWKQLGSRPEHLATLGALYMYHAVAAHLDTALAMGEQLLDIAQSTGNPVALPLASWCLGVALHHLGRHREALAVLDRGLAAHSVELASSYTSVLIEPGVGSAAEKARTLWVLGYPEQAMRALDHALQLADVVPHPEARGFAQLFGAFVYQCLGDVEATYRHAQAVLAIARERDIATSLAWGMVLHGWAVAIRGNADEGIREIRESLEMQNAAGAFIAYPQFNALLADACLSAGKLDEALDATANGLGTSARTSDHYWDSELERLRGEALHRQNSSAAEVDACFERAIADARARNAKSLELRAATSAARVWHARGEGERARRALEPCYLWFTEGFATHDLLAARELLDTLS